VRTSILLPPLTPEEYQSLKSDIQKNGILVPIIRTEDGETIDGHNREQIAADLGITDIPVKVVTGLGDEERRHMRIRLNAARRQLTAEQKRHLIREELKKSPDLSNNWLAELLCVDDKTVQAVRADLETTGDIEAVTLFRCKDGKRRKYHRVTRQQKIAAVVEQHEAPAVQVCSTTTDEAQLALPTIQLGEPTILAVPTADDIQIIHGDFRTLNLAPASAKLVLTDPPYDRDSIPLWDDLAVLAEKVLVDGGVLLAYAGTMFLPETIAALSKTLVYRWMLATVHEGSGGRVHSLNFASCWTPVVLFTKGKYAAPGGTPLRDIVQGVGPEKKYHPWQKPLAEVEHLIKAFSSPGDLVVDPFGGSFTTAVACKRLGRRCISCDIDQGCVVTGEQRTKEIARFQAA
jgi:hypothetical protein